ncbi:membrane protein insertase YidC [Desulfobulbus sp. F5]|nr:membrane protein insertase YidC [Desulfobulbus sp. F5]
MDMQRAFLAILLSFLILVGYQYLFVPVQPVVPTESNQHVTAVPQSSAQSETTATTATPTPAAVVPTVALDSTARDITVETPLYKAIFFEQGGGLKSFILKKYRQARDKNSPPVELITVSSNPAEWPMTFTVDGGVTAELPLFKAKETAINLNQGDASLLLHAELANGLHIERKLIFHADSYLIDSSCTVTNKGTAPAQVHPTLSMSNGPLHSGGAASSLFSGPAVYVNRQLHEISAKELSKGPLSFQGEVSWAAHMDSYFMLSLLPKKNSGSAITVMAIDEKKIRTVLTNGTIELAPGEAKVFGHDGYFGPKKMVYLKQAGYDLEEAINLGWFGVLAKPMLWLLNFFHDIFGNYGIAIILLTCVVKGAFWPITHKGMKSMKNMQKIQPKVAKLREKYKDDPVKMNQEMMAMYKTYKVNPIGGCLPMFIQIPFFFALYKVLMAAIELRHAPFMLWMHDLSAPDRLMIGFDIPWLHGIPVLTLLMGGTMFLQQKMSPTTADPQQAKMMQMMPVIFTVMFVNFASGLVLYWFVSNLLSILQQQLINRQTATAATPN